MAGEERRGVSLLRGPARLANRCFCRREGLSWLWRRKQLLLGTQSQPLWALLMPLPAHLHLGSLLRSPLLPASFVSAQPASRSFEPPLRDRCGFRTRINWAAFDNYSSADGMLSAVCRQTRTRYGSVESQDPRGCFGLNVVPPNQISSVEMEASLSICGSWVKMQSMG